MECPQRLSETPTPGLDSSFFGKQISARFFRSLRFSIDFMDISQGPRASHTIQIPYSKPCALIPPV